VTFDLRETLLVAHRAAAGTASLRAVLEVLTEQLRDGLGCAWVLGVVRDTLTLEVRCGVLAGVTDLTAPLLHVLAADPDPADRVVVAGSQDPMAVALEVGSVDCWGVALEAEARRAVAQTAEAEVGRAVRQETLSRRATHDGATGLPGPLLLDDVLRAAPDDAEVALLIVSVDQLRAVTRSFGRAAGNEMLRKVAARLLVAGGAGAWSVYRLPRGLGVLTVGLPGTARAAADDVMVALQEPWVLGRRSVRSTCRIGLAVRAEGQVGSSLVECAEAALDAAVTRLRAGVVVHGPEMTASAHESLVLETLLHAGLEPVSYGSGTNPKWRWPRGASSAPRRWSAGCVPRGWSRRIGSSLPPKRAGLSSISTTGCCGRPASRPVSGSMQGDSRCAWR
jgi:GGDEF domain-containing protein